MASKYDLVHLIGSKTCALASHLTELVAAEPACTTAQTWSMGFLVMTAVVAVLAALVVAERRKLRRQTYFWTWF